MAAFQQSMALLEAVDRLTEVGIVVSDYRDRITPKDQAVAVVELRETGRLLTPPGARPLHRPRDTSGLRLVGPL
ncbi:hypothetical protein M3C75_010320 [Micrococcus luteus]|nr:hypothetical protein [Micrococcus luteus]